jgi:hypothetical protein
MIVKDKQEILDNANDVSNKFLYTIEKQIKKFLKDEDVASQIYFQIYCVSILMSKISLGIEKFCQMYGNLTLDSNGVINWINEVTKEIVIENSSKLH